MQHRNIIVLHIDIIAKKIYQPSKYPHVNDAEAIIKRGFPKVINLMRSFL